MKKYLTHLFSMLIVAVIFSSCIKESLRGEGNIITETRTLSNFKKVIFSGSRHAEIIKSTESKVEITGYANLVAALRNNTVNDRLWFEYPNRYWVRNDNVYLKIYTPNLEAVDLSGSGVITIREGFSATHFNSDLSGSGSVTLQNGSFENANLKVSGIGSINLENGNMEKVSLNISGSGKINGETTQTERAEAQISGSGKIKIRTSDLLKVRISGSGEVKYWGNPQTDINISGSGKALKQ